ncbi:MAG: hypothetical protein CL933_24050 [Deltaproteobacteria bacterium]|nr:hypothetical protein [Deltaproteobacteria bacterium]
MRNKRLIVILVAITLIAGYFWSQSRIPDLNVKADMGDEINLDDPLSFDAILIPEKNAPLLVKVAYSTVNWAYTNRKGMIFGVTIGAALMGLFSILSRRSYKSAILNSSIGVLVGAPLGVCVNCATPIAQGIYSAGARLEMALATMMSSPTLNIIVLTMLFSLFPPYMVAIKLGLTLGFLILGLPLLSRFFVDEGALTISEESCPIDLNPVDYDPDESWWAALRWTLRSYFENLWWVVRRTVPLMFVAGAIGSLAVHALPWDAVAGLFEDHGGRIYDFLGDFGVALVGLSIVASLGIFLPVPMTFDLLIVAILMAAGMPVHYAMALLFTLGIFSVYAFTVVWNDMSRRAAIMVPAALVLLGVLAGVGALEFDEMDRERQTGVLLQALGSELEVSEPVDEGPTRTYAELQPELMDGQRAASLVTDLHAEGITIHRTPFADPRTDAAASLFERSEGMAHGIEEPYAFDLASMMRPYMFHAGIASGDIHGDGWDDIVMTSRTRGISLYANLKGRFVGQSLDLPEIEDAFVTQVALVDLDDDGSLDLVITTYMKGNFVVYNHHGEFLPENLRVLPNVDPVRSMTASLSFGDLDGDGDLEIAVGNVAPFNSQPAGQNLVLYPEGREYEVRPLDEISGSTLSSLFSDINDDGYLDLMIGNEGKPSAFYLGDGTGDLQRVLRSDGLVPYTPMRTMSVTSADVNNDLKPEMYLGQITGFATQSAHLRTRPVEDLCAELSDGLRERCEKDVATFQVVRRSGRARDARRCATLEQPGDRDACYAYHALNRAKWRKEEGPCDHLPERWSGVELRCRGLFAGQLSYSEAKTAEAIPSITNDNVLLMADQKGNFADHAEELGVILAGWTWNAKFADLDHDEWVDLYVANGLFFSKTRESNYLYLNQEGKGFADATVESGAEGYFPTSAYTYIDFDNDGDLDIITMPLHGPVWVYENGSSNSNSVTFSLRDHRGNRFGLGTKIVIRYGDGRKQMREIQSGGGFTSFDAPFAHFGLGEFDGVEEVEIRWSTGEKSVMRGDFEAGSRYRITRAASEGSSVAGPVVMRSPSRFPGLS